MNRFVIALLLTTTALAEDWPQWRGPHHNGVSAEENPPTEWASDKNIRWKAPLPGPAGSTPIVIGERIFITSAEGDRLVLLCYTTAGKQAWRRDIAAGDRDFRGDEGNLASPSPVADDQHVATLMGDGTLACFTHAGEEVWRLDLNTLYGQLDIQFGYSSTPVLHDGRLYLQIIHGDGDPATQEARVVCLDFTTGQEVWAVNRITGAKAECEHSYASPVIYEDKERTLLLTHGGDFTIAHDLKTGAELWRLGGFNLPGNYNPTLRFVASPGIGLLEGGEGIIIAPSAKRGSIAAVKPDGSGDITGTNSELWRLPKSTPDVPTPLVYDGLVYLCGEDGRLTVVDAMSGEEIYERRTESDRHRASPIAAAGKVYLTSRGGVVTVIEAGREFKRIARNELKEPISASPVFANGVLYLRTFENLYAIGAE
jgi:outer membrane protein assembly factor BamB